MVCCTAPRRGTIAAGAGSSATGTRVTWGPMKGRAGDATDTLRAAQGENHHTVGKLMRVFEDGRTNHLHRSITQVSVASADGVTQIVQNQIQD